MKRFLFFVLAATLPILGFSQFTFQNNGDTLRVEPLNKDVDFFLQLKNDTSVTYDVRWRIMDNSFPDTNWVDYTCDYYCYTEETRANTFQLNKDTNFIIIHHVRPAVTHGTGYSTLCIFDPNDSANTIQCVTVWVESDTSQPPLGIEEEKDNQLSQNYPNPFTESTTIPYQSNGMGAANLIIRDLLGQVVKTVQLDPNQSSVNINADFASGAYLYAIEQNGELSGIRKFTVIK